MTSGLGLLHFCFGRMCLRGLPAQHINKQHKSGFEKQRQSPSPRKIKKTRQEIAAKKDSTDDILDESA